MTTDYQAYYQTMLNYVVSETNTVYEPQYFQYLLQNNIVLTQTLLSGITITVFGSTIEQAELSFYEALDANNIINNLQYYLVDKTLSMTVISYVMTLLYSTVPTTKQVNYFFYHNSGIVEFPNVHTANYINLFTFLMCLRFYPEGQILNYPAYFNTIFKQIKYSLPTITVPKCAILLSGLCRTFANQASSQQILVNNPYIDIFIHTWSNRGIRIEFNGDQTNEALLMSTYNPSAIRVDPVINDFKQFSLNSTVQPIYFYHGQRPSDDPAKYVNADLYSLNQSFLLMEAFETTKSFQYDVIFRFKFDYNVTHFDFPAIAAQIIPQDGVYMVENVQFTTIQNPESDTEEIDVNIASSNDWTPQVIWFSNGAADGHLQHGGGCKRCDIDGNLTNHLYGEHTNDLTDTFFYGLRNLVAPACQLYNSASNLYLSHQASNNARIFNSNIAYREYYNQYYWVYITDDALPVNDIFPYHPNRMLRQLLKTTICRSTSNIAGTIHDILYLPFDVYPFT